MNIKQYLLSNTCSQTLSEKLIEQIKKLYIKFDSAQTEVYAWDEINSWKPTDPISHEARVEKLVHDLWVDENHFACLHDLSAMGVEDDEY